MLKNRIFLWVFGCLSLGGCGYQWSSYEGSKTISIPYVVGDKDGALTAAIIHRFCSASNVQVASNGRYRLDATIVEESAEPLGFRRDPQKVRGKIRKNLVQNEGRKTIFLDVSLFDRQTDSIVFEPVRVSVCENYDYIDGDSIQDLRFQDALGQNHVVLPFSLGQLEPEEAAQEASQRPLYQKVSQKIVDIVTSQW